MSLNITLMIPRIMCRCSLLLSVATTLFVTTNSFALDRKASYALSHYMMGVMYDDLGQAEQAIQEYKKVLKSEPENSVVHLSLAASFIKNNNIPKAVDELNTVIKLDPGAVEPHAILAILYSSQNKQDEAAGEYETALKNASKLQPDNIDIYKSLGAIYVQQKKFKQAEAIYKLVIKLSANDAEAHFYLASVYNELKDNNTAETELKKALALKPDYDDALNFLGYMYVDSDKNLDQAEAMIKKALELSPDNGAYIDSLGWFYFKKGKFKEALTQLQKASSLMEDPVIYDHLGDAYLKLNDPANAKLNWQKSLKLDAKQDKVKQKLEKITQNEKSKTQK